MIAPDVARKLERSLAAFDEAEHEALVAHRREASAQRASEALCYAVTGGDRDLVRSIIGALEQAGLGGIFRVFAVHDGRALLWMNGPAKTRSSELRDEVVRTLRAAGHEVEQRGSWDLSVWRGERRKDG